MQRHAPACTNHANLNVDKRITYQFKNSRCWWKFLHKPYNVFQLGFYIFFLEGLMDLSIISYYLEVLLSWCSHYLGFCFTFNEYFLEVLHIMFPLLGFYLHSLTNHNIEQAYFSHILVYFKFYFRLSLCKGIRLHAQTMLTYP